MKILENIVFPVVVAIIGAMVVTPLGDIVKGSLFPPKFTVEGMVMDSDEPIATARVEVYREETQKFVDTTNPRGKFFVEDVYPEGTYDFLIVNTTDSSIMWGNDELHLSMNELEENVGIIDIATFVTEEGGPESQKQESQFATEVNPIFKPEEKQADYQIYLVYQDKPSATLQDYHNITVWLSTSQQTLSLIDKVTYYLHPTLEPDVVTQSSPSDNFALSFNAWGQFKLVAKVYFKDNQVKDLAGNIVFH